jgi:signal transduction histidine kinase/CheY-like chemotaxis protein
VDGLVVVDAEGRIADWGPAAAAVLGADPASANLIAHVHADDRPIARAHLARSADREDRADFRIVVGERDRVIESVGRPHPGGAAQLVLRDVTQRRSLDQGLLHAARLETVAVLLGGIAHDFNNMLGTLLAHVGILQSTVTDERAAERLGRMEATIERASQLTRRLLTVSRGSASSLGPVELDRVLRAAADLVEPTLPHNIRLVEDVPEGVAPVHGDAQDLEQVVVNLLVNARDALKEGGNIRLAVRPWSLEGGHRGLAVLVEDDGTGVPPNLVADVFQPFVTTKGRKGTGLGLAVASQILRDHQGRIWYEDRPGGGARFLLALRHADALDEAPAPLPEGRRILLVEDEEVLIEGYARALRESGYDVVPFQRAADAAAWLEGHRPDVLVTDVVMEGMNGIELATLCQAAHPTVPILVVSGFIPDDSVRALSAGTWHRLHKPVRAARLVATVGRIRRRVERAARGEADITRVTWLFPPLDVLNAARLGFDTRP